MGGLRSIISSLSWLSLYLSLYRYFCYYNIFTSKLQPLDTSNAGGEVVRYRLDYRNLDTGQAWDSLSVAGNNYEGTLLLMAGNSYMVQIRAATKVGVSGVFSQILIPAKERSKFAYTHNKSF